MADAKGGIQRWTDTQVARLKEATGTPIVTVFGAGVAGLSVAHELIERGFNVQVVEAKGDPDEEYCCQVGGLAASQLVRTEADVERLHPYLFNEDPNVEDTAEDAERGVWVWAVGQSTEKLEVRIDDTQVQVDTTKLSPERIAEDIRTRVNAISGLLATDVPNERATILIRSVDSSRTPRVRIRQTGGAPSKIVFHEQVAPLSRLRARPMQETQQRVAIPERIQFERDSTADWRTLRDQHGVPNSVKLELVWTGLQRAYKAYAGTRETTIQAAKTTGELLEHDLSKRMRVRETLLVEIRAHTDSEDTAKANHAQALAWGRVVRQWLLDRNTSENAIPNLAPHLIVVPVGGRAPLGNPKLESGRRRSNRIEFRIVENVLPGEHGYRFFPRFYKHLFDTMKRTPILEYDGAETGETAYDRLVTTDVVDLAFDRAPKILTRPHPPDPREPQDPESVRIRVPRSLDELRTLVRLHLNKDRIGISERDIVRFQFKLLMFLTASSARRQQWEGQTWAQFLGVDKNDFYSESMKRVLQDTPQALVAMNADETDARTMGVIYSQLLLDTFGDGSQSNLTLNGPTSAAWLEEWKRYLRRQGVRFFRGRLSELVWAGAHPDLLPLVTIAKFAGESAQVAVLRASPVKYASEYRLTVTGATITIAPLAGRDRDGVAAALIESINSTPNLPAVAEAGDAEGIVRIRLPSDGESKLAFPAGAALYTVHSTRPGAKLAVNGVLFESLEDSPEAIRQDLNEQMRRQDPSISRAEITDYGTRSGRVSARRGEAIVSVVGEKAGTYGVRINGKTFKYSAAPRLTGEDIRDGLLERIGALPDVEILRFGVTGIVFRPLPRRAGAGRDRGVPPLTVDVTPWPGRMELGPVLWAVSGEGLSVTRGGELSIVPHDPKQLGIVGAVPEIAGQDYIASPLSGLLEAPGGGPDFYVMALDHATASSLIWEAGTSTSGPKMDGVFGELMTFDEKTGYRQPDGTLNDVVRDGAGRPVPHAPDASGARPHYPFRDLSGLQYYFENQVRVGQAHTYFMDAPWGLSSISQLAYWRQRMSQQSAFLGQLSVDIGNFYQPVEQEVAVGKTGSRGDITPSAWRCGKQEIANEVWRQVKAGLDPLTGRYIEPPRYYHLDDGIRFERDDDEAKEFGRHVVVTLTGSPAALTIAGYPAINGTSPAELATRIEIATKAHHLAAVLSQDRIVIAPEAQHAKDIRVVVLLAKAVTYRISINGAVAEYAAQSQEGIEIIRRHLIDAVMANIPGVIAEPEPKRRRGPTMCTLERGESEGQARGIRLRSTREFRVSVIAVDANAAPIDPVSLMATNPTGVVSIDLRERLKFEHPELASPRFNATLFQINGPNHRNSNGDEVLVWRSRPGMHRPSSGTKNVAHKEVRAGGMPIDRRSDIFYTATRDRWLMAGTHMATYTRVTSMESANESARHAVIGILHKILGQRPQVPRGGWTKGTSHHVGQGRNRLLIVAAGGVSTAKGPGIDSVTYGGQKMSLITRIKTGASAPSYVGSLWCLNDKGIAGAKGHKIIVAPSGTTFRNIEVAAATYFDVDQASPIGAHVEKKGSADRQLSAQIQVAVGNGAVAAAGCGTGTVSMWAPDHDFSQNETLVKGATWATADLRVSASESIESARAVFADGAKNQVLLVAEIRADPLYNSQGKLLGDFPTVWNPEDFELDDTAYLKRLDQRLLEHTNADGEKAELPHFLELLKVDQWIENLPELRKQIADDKELAPLTQLARDQFLGDWEDTTADEMESSVRRVLKVLLDVQDPKKPVG